MELYFFFWVGRASGIEFHYFPEVGDIAGIEFYYFSKVAGGWPGQDEEA